jgi:nucleoid-associated protein Lsr2
MATKTQVVLVDDLTGDPADTTVKFALDKTEYEIDLSDENAAEMRDGLSRYVDAARKVTGGGRRSAPAAAKSAYAGYDPVAVRAWAAGKGIEVNARGRIKADVVEQFRAAGN